MTSDVFPSLPDGAVTAAITGDRRAAEILSSLGIDVITVSPEARLPEPVRSHADMLCCHVAPDIIITFDPDLAEKLRRIGMDVRLTRVIPGDRYPLDVPLNCARIGDIILCGKGTFAPEISAAARDIGIELIYTNQGYARCSTAIVDERSAITADKGIYKALTALGYDMLLISPGHIALPGYDCGFIGGCCGKISRDTMLFLGDIHAHPDGGAIDGFLRSKGIRPLCIGENELFDFGGFIPIQQMLT